MTIATARLRLIPSSPIHLLALIDGLEQFEQSSGMKAAAGLREFFVSGDVSPEWLAQLRASTVADPWQHGFAVFYPESNSVIGSVGFKGRPDDAGIVEIAYGIVPVFQGRGYATEAAKAGIAYVLGDERVRMVRAHTMATNNASTRVLAKCGFTFVGEVVDPADGPLWRWELSGEAA
jgi:[ribosomal protein S5]-alanine N-acetyltransferase